MAGPQRTPPQPRTRPRPPLLRCIFIVLIVLVLLLGLIALIVWLVVRPRPLEYTVEDAHVHGFNLTGNTLNATFNITLRAHNPNHRISIYYDSFDLAVWYSDQMIAFSDVEPFLQPHRNDTKLDVEASAQATPLMGSVSSSLKHERSGGEVDLEVRVKARIRFKVGLFKSKHYRLRVYCSPVLVRFSSSKPFERTYCDVDI